VTCKVRWGSHASGLPGGRREPENVNPPPAPPSYADLGAITGDGTGPSTANPDTSRSNNCPERRHPIVENGITLFPWVEDVVEASRTMGYEEMP